jgi:hypothetical protein
MEKAEETSFPEIKTDAATLRDAYFIWQQHAAKPTAPAV